MPSYDPSRGGHAPGHIREMLLEYLDAGDHPLDQSVVGQLWNGTDALPASYRDELEIPRGSTYAQAVRHIARVWASLAN